MPGGAHENMRGWSPEEDELLLQLIERSGKRWKYIAEQLGNSNPRTAAMVRNRYLRIERGRQLTQEGKSKNRCGVCGELKRGHVCRGTKDGEGGSAGAGAMAFEKAFARAHGASGSSGGGSHGRNGAPGSPPSPAQSVSTKLNLGAAAPLTMVPAGGLDDACMSIGSPDMAAFGMTPSGMGRSPMHSLGTFGGVNPPGLRPQSSFDVLMAAADMKEKADVGGPPTISRPAPHPTSTMNILADTPNGNGDFPFGNPSAAGGGGAAGGSMGSQTPFSSMKGERAFDGLPSPTALSASILSTCSSCVAEDGTTITSQPPSVAELREKALYQRTEQIVNSETLSEELSEEAA